MIDYQFHIETDLLRFEVKPGDKPQAFFIRRSCRKGSRAGKTAEPEWPPHEPVSLVLLCPPGTNFKDTNRQQWLFQVLTEQLRKQAKLLLPDRLHTLACRHGLPFSRVSINSARTRWGSCSSRKSINLSLYLMLLPSRLIDYVLLHELCHTREMNHGPRFWALLDSLTGGQARALRKELRCFRPQF